MAVPPDNAQRLGQGAPFTAPWAAYVHPRVQGALPDLFFILGGACCSVPQAGAEEPEEARVGELLQDVVQPLGVRALDRLHVAPRVVWQRRVWIPR